MAKVKTETKHPVGRPSKYSQELADDVCSYLSTGESLRTVCTHKGMPEARTIFRWLREKEDFCQQYTRAKQEAADALAEEIIDIADDGTNDYMTITKGDYSYNVEDKEVTNRSKLRVETRKWIMAKMKPKKYGDKVDVTSGGEKIETNTIVLSDFSNAAKG